MVNINFSEIFDGTYHIFLFYLVFLSVLLYFMLVSNHFTKIFQKLNKIHVSKDESKFRLNYLAILILIIIIITSIIIIGYRELRANNFQMFVVFAIFAFWILPFALGLLGLYSYIIANNESNFGTDLMLAISFVCFGALGSNLHDVIWCGVHTNWYQTKNIAGDDIALFYVAFGILDPNKVDYRSFGLFMLVQVIIELTIGIIAFYKYYQLNQVSEKVTNYKPYLITLLLFIITGSLLGVVEYIFDAPWHFTELEYKLDIYLGIPIIALLFFLSGFYLGKKNKALREANNS